MSRITYQWYYRIQIECLSPIRVRSGDLERIKKLLIIPVIEETPERGETEGDKVDDDD